MSNLSFKVCFHSFQKMLKTKEIGVYISFSLIYLTLANNAQLEAKFLRVVTKVPPKDFFLLSEEN